MKKEKEVQVTKKEEVYYCDECGKEITPDSLFVLSDWKEGISNCKVVIYLHEECQKPFINKILALRAEPKE